MKIKIKSFNGELPDYFTEGKVYDVVEMWGRKSGVIMVDTMQIIFNLDSCKSLNGGSWEVVND